MLEASGLIDTSGVDLERTGLLLSLAEILPLGHPGRPSGSVRWLLDSMTDARSSPVDSLYSGGSGLDSKSRKGIL